MMERLQVVQLLIEFPEDLDDISIKLSKFCFDYDGEQVILTLKDVGKALGLFIKGMKTEEEIENWANLIEGREDIEFFEDDEEILDEVMHKLANPYLQGNLTLKYCEEFLSKYA
jgi:hypothetical protein